MNPLWIRRLVELCGLYKRRHYLRTGKGNPFVNYVQARLEPTSVTLEQFERHGAIANADVTRAASGLAKQDANGPGAGRGRGGGRALGGTSDATRQKSHT